ncbi:MAG: phosphohydrolase [Syntrophobacteraceae bacterium]
MKCPGQDSRYWQPGAIFETKCPQCGSEVEFFKDESSRKCRKCGAKCMNPKMDFGCATYCKFASQCLGELPPELLAQKDHLLKDRLALEIKRLLKKDFKRIARTVKTARYAEELVKEEKCDPSVTLLAAHLCGLAPLEPGRSPEDSTGLDTAMEILAGLGTRAELQGEVRKAIQSRHSPEEGDVRIKILHDAETLALLEEQQHINPVEGTELDELIRRDFATESGQKLAARVLTESSR